MVAEIDRQMALHYRLYRTNVWAWEWLHGAPAPEGLLFHEGSISEQSFRTRVDSIAPEHRQWMLAMYANPVDRQLALQAASRDSSCD